MKCKIKKGFRCDGQRCASCPEHAKGLEVGEYTDNLTDAQELYRQVFGQSVETGRTHASPGPVETGTDRRRAILKEVEACVCRDRQNSYGDAENNFADIAGIVNIVLERKLKEPLAPEDVATFCAAIKLARIKTSPDHLDNWVDLAGYGVCGAGIVKSRTA